jgi:hypothetical protein
MPTIEADLIPLSASYRPTPARSLVHMHIPALVATVTMFQQQRPGAFVDSQSYSVLDLPIVNRSSDGTPILCPQREVGHIDTAAQLNRRIVRSIHPPSLAHSTVV